VAGYAGRAEGPSLSSQHAMPAGQMPVSKEHPLDTGQGDGHAFRAINRLFAFPAQKAHCLLEKR